MKIIFRKSNNIVIWGTDNNSTQAELVDGNFIVDGQVVARGVNADNFELVEDLNSSLCTPFFVGYASYVDGYLAPTEEYYSWNGKQKTCIQEVRLEYYLKSQDTQYTDEERQAFVDYYTLLDELNQTEFLDPTFSYPVPPDETFPYIPSCCL